MFRKVTFTFIIFFISCTSFLSQEVPPINVFLTQDYGAENQNWDVTQASNKFIYVANNAGLLEYNGEDWELYPTPNETIMRSVQWYDDKIYTGFYMDFGFWEKNKFGLLEYTSLIKDSKIKMIEDEQIWEIAVLDGWVLFKSLSRIYMYNLSTKSFKIINAENNISKLSKVESTIYFQEINKGIFKIENGIPNLISDHKVLKENKIIDFFLKDNKLFFVTQKNGLYYLEKGEVQKWMIPANTVLSNKTIYSSKLLKNGVIVLGTISNGLIKIKKNGELYYEISQGTGLSNNTILKIFEDIDENLWLGLDNGINTINAKSPFKLFVKKNNFWGTIYASIVYKDYLYLGTNQGLYYKKINSEESFQLIKNTQGQVWNLQEIDNTLFCSHDSGTFTINNFTADLIATIEGTWNLKQINENTILQGNYDGLYVLKKKKGNWSLNNKIEGFSNSSKYFVLTKNNQIFVNHEYKGVFKLKVDSNFQKVLTVDKDQSVEKGIHSSLINYQDDILYSCKKGIYKYDSIKDAFKRDSLLSKLMPENSFLSAKLIYHTTNNKLWSFTKEDMRFITPGKLSNKPVLNIIPIKGSIYKGSSGYENIILLSDKKYLVGTYNGYLILDLDAIKEPKDYEVSITRVFKNELDNSKINVSLKDEIDFKNNENNVQFYYSVPNYNKASSLLYQYKLEGLNEKWSSLSNKNYILFENLSPGDYSFKVRSYLDSKYSSNIASYSFNIALPWYLSNFAIFIYIVLLLVLFYIWHILAKKYYKNQREELLEKAQRELELKELESSQKIIKLNNDKLRSDIESKNRELATSTMSIIKKNEFLSSIKIELLNNGKENVSKVVKIIDKNLNNTDDWKLFQEAFNNADKNFLKKIKEKHPQLTPNDLRLCAYLRLNLSSKEIAPLLNISPRSVEVKRYRLRKKMSLDHNENLTNYILDI